jgi:phage-related protein
MDADGKVYLFEITLKTNVQFNFKRFESVTWQGKTYEAMEIALSEIGRNSSEEAVRPTLSMANPDGLLTYSVLTGDWNNAEVVRRTVLYDDMINNRGSQVIERWSVSRITRCDYQAFALELRSPADRLNAIIPARTFNPPEFPFVTLR